MTNSVFWLFSPIDLFHQLFSNSLTYSASQRSCHTHIRSTAGSQGGTHYAGVQGIW